MSGTDAASATVSVSHAGDDEWKAAQQQEGKQHKADKAAGRTTTLRAACALLEGPRETLELNGVRVPCVGR